MRIFRILFRASFSLAIFSLSLNATAQGSIVASGNQAFENNQYASAIKYYTRALDRSKVEKSERNDLILNLASCYRFTNNQAKAEIYYLQLIKNKYAEKNQLFISITPGPLWIRESIKRP